MKKDIKFEANKLYRLTYPDGKYITIRLVGCMSPLKFEVMEDHTIKTEVELFQGNPTIEEIGDTLGNI